MLSERINKKGKSLIIDKLEKDYHESIKEMNPYHWLWDQYKQKLDSWCKNIKNIMELLLDDRYCDSEWEDLIISQENEKTISTIKSEIENLELGKWMIIHGPQGTGKTLIKNIIIKDLFLKFNRQPYVCTMYSLYLDYLSSLKNKRDGPDKLLNDIAHHEIIIIDEIGRKECSQAIHDFLFEVMDRCYNKKHTAILISNLPVVSTTGQSISTYIDYDRMKEVGMSLPLVGESKRGK